MFDSYKKDQDFQIILCYFMDVYARSKDTGRWALPTDIFLENTNSEIQNYLKEGVRLIGDALFPSIFSWFLETGLFKVAQNCKTERDFAKLTMIKYLIVCIYEENLKGILETSNFWADSTWSHGKEVLYHFLDEEDIFFREF